MSFSIMIENWTTDTNGDELPVCEISSSVEITNALQDFDAFSAEEILIDEENGQHIASFIFWRASRIHCDIGGVHLIMINLDDRVGILLYSKTAKFSVDNIAAMYDKDVWRSFAVLEGTEKIEVNSVYTP